MSDGDYKQVSIIYTTTDDSIFCIDENHTRKVDDDVVKEMEEFICHTSIGIPPLVVINTSTGFLLLDGQHRLQAIRNLNRDRDEKIEIPFYINWKGRRI
jgi:hypothetical protein